ncbi:CYTH and CHAD domain-containing protein [Hwanghaeella grinnelliae]|uniref:CYTH and CHAD domain-containing protein n=1 Tax=Hwanghaeella grinnelliae TaxID=2500179 RepID=A0A3S2WBB4_9PROT|nr:CYTH and CHAD domain-containing protein [Hwanghaeella grinnelliae]RVU38494.1 CYTH and CHAD domain-containing protein [Hwanghaeella grinnelliae]
MAFEEIEIKLRLAPRDAGRFRRARLLQEYKTAKAGWAHLVSTYFDTPDLALRTRKVALRIRRMGDALEQTLKAPKGLQGGLQSRTEWNAVVENEEKPDLSSIGDPKLRKWLRKRTKENGLTAVFTTDIKRTTWQILYNGTRLEVALDEGQILAGDRSRPISEVELELVEGDATDLVAFAQLLIEKYPLVLDRDSKAARGYALFADTEVSPVKAKDPDLTTDMTVWNAFSASVQSGVLQVMSNAPVVMLRDDPEGVHQARIGVRRIRAALSLFKNALDADKVAVAREDLKWLQQALGPARDFDVFLEEAVEPLIKAMPDEACLTRLKEVSETARKNGYDMAVDALSSSRYSAVLLRLEAWLLSPEHAAADVPLAQFAKRSLDKRLKAVLKSCGKHPARLPEADLHPLRIEFKKLRYAASFFQSLYGGKKKFAYIKQLAALQDCLGGLNDALVQGELMEALPLGKAADAARAKALMTGWHAARTQQGLSGLDKEWAAFKAFKPFWR